MKKAILISFVSALVFFGTGFLLFYIVNARSGLQSSTGDKLTSVKRNELVNKIQNISSDASGTTFSGTVKIGNHNLAKQITVCKKRDSTYANTAGTATTYQWTSSDCDNGLPSGTCMGFLSQASCNGEDEDRTLRNPGETGLVNGGITWRTVSRAGLGLWIRAVYFCY